MRGFATHGEANTPSGSESREIRRQQFACCKQSFLKLWYNIGVLYMCMLDEIAAKRDMIHAIAKGHKAEKLWVFGSCARKEERPDSDVDFLVKFDPCVGHKDYTAIEQGLSSLLGRSVDVVSTRILPSSPRFANRVCREAVAI